MMIKYSKPYSTEEMTLLKNIELLQWYKVTKEYIYSQRDRIKELLNIDIQTCDNKKEIHQEINNVIKEVNKRKEKLERIDTSTKKVSEISKEKEQLIEQITHKWKMLLDQYISEELSKITSLVIDKNINNEFTSMWKEISETLEQLVEKSRTFAQSRVSGKREYLD